MLWVRSKLPNLLLLWISCKYCTTAFIVHTWGRRSSTLSYHVNKQHRSEGRSHTLHVLKSKMVRRREGYEESSTGISSSEILIKNNVPNLTIILPAYNEALRIEETILQYAAYLSNSPVWGRTQHDTHHTSNSTTTSAATTSEILVVDDGSNDGTIEVVNVVANNIHEKFPGVKIKCVSIPQNEGKGAAISRGCLESGDDCSVLLVADADGSGNIACLDAMLSALAQSIFISDPHKCSSTNDITGVDVPYTENMNDVYTPSFWDTPALVVGKRKSKEEDKSKLRSILRWGFQTCVAAICGGDLGVTDTQCGFKLMTRTVGTKLYPALHLRRWAHDVEILCMARDLGYAVDEVDVDWVDKPGSKLVNSPFDAVGASLSMLWDISVMRIKYLVGLWKINDNVGGDH